MNDLSNLQNYILELNTDAPKERYVELLSTLRFVKDAVKTMEKLLEEKGIELIETHGPIRSGDFLYTVGISSTWKPVKTPTEMAQGIMELLGGDWDAFASCLASGAFKQGQFKTLLKQHGFEDQFKDYFRLEMKKNVDEKPAKKVQEINLQFAK